MTTRFPALLDAQRATRVAPWFAAGAFGVLSLTLARRDPGYAFAGASPARGAAELAAGGALMACGLLSWQRRGLHGFGALTTAGGFGWFLLEWNNPGVGSAAVFTIGLVLFLVAPPLVAHAVLAYPAGRLGPPLERAGLAVAYSGAIVVLGLLPALVFDPVAQGCSECPRNLVLVHGDSGAYDTLNSTGAWLGLAWSLLLIALIVWRFLRSTAAMRGLLMPVLATGGAYLVLVAALFAHSLDRGFVSNGALDRRLWLGQAATLVALALGVASSWLRARRTRTALARIVVDLSATPVPGALEQALAKRLGDPRLRLAYPVADGRYVDAAGHELAVTQETTPLVRDGVEVARLVHQPGLLDDQALVDELTRATRLVLDNERLQAEARAQLEDLRASRARVIADGDAARRRLERDLHDGAQQRLVGLALTLSLARVQGGPDADARIGEAEAELRAALADLRELAHGIFPAILADEGFAAAVEALAEEAPIRIAALPLDRLDPAVEAAAYLVVAETIKHSDAGTVTLKAAHRRGLLVLDLECEHAPDELVEIEDRVGALDGRLGVVRSASGSVTIRAEIPCES
jgi:signal transduction histidine kinase